MKWLITFCLLLIILAGCPATSPPPETYTPPTTTIPPETTPEPTVPEFIEVPLSYEVIRSFIETDIYEGKFRIFDGDVLVHEEILDIIYPIGCVTLRNTDNVPGEYRVIFSFYKIPDYQAEAYKEAFGELDEDYMKAVGDKYCDEITLSLDIDEEDTARYEVRDIHIASHEWYWEFEVIPSTKPVEK